MNIITFLRRNGGYYRSDEIGQGCGMATEYVEDRLSALLRRGLVESRVYDMRDGLSKNDIRTYAELQQSEPVKRWRAAT